MAKWKKNHIAPSVLLGVAIMPMQALALDGAMYVGGAAEYTSNSLQTATDEQSDTLIIGLGGVDLNHASSDLDVQANYSLERSTYLDETQGDESTINGRGEASWHIRPDTLSWDFRHSSARSRGIRSARDTEANRTTQKVYATGPRSLLHLSPRDSLELSAEAMQVSTSGRTDNESNREVYDATLSHATSEIQSFGLSASHQNVDFEGEGGAAMKFSQAAVNWERDHRLGGMRLSVGRNRSEREGFDAFEGDLLRAYIDFSNVGHTISFAAVNELTDSMLGLNNTDAILTRLPEQASTDGTDVSTPIIDQPSTPGDGFNPEPTNLDVIDALESKRFEINYSTARLCELCSPSLRLSWDEQDYITQPLDQRVFGVTASLGYRVSERVTTSFSISRSEEEYLEEDDRTDETLAETVSMVYRAWEDLEFEGFIANQQRDSTIEGAEYDELSARVGFRYYFANF